MSTAGPLQVVVGCDADPDRPDFGGIPFDAGCQRQAWKGIERIPLLRRQLDDSDLWKKFEDAGDEIGWHPHFWRLDADGRTWFQETRDVEFQKRVLQRGHRALSAARGRPPQSVRMGWQYHNNEGMAELANLGVKVDFSALPFQRFAGSHHDRGARFLGEFDWEVTAPGPYRPSASDYRTPGEAGQSLEILELPLGSLRSRLVGFLGEARGALRQRSPGRMLKALLRGGRLAHASIQACSPPVLFRAMVRDTLERGDDFLVTYFHPDELLPDKGQFVNNLIHRPAYFLENMRATIRLARRARREVTFLTAAEAARSVSP